jgi:hypothetical protein
LNNPKDIKEELISLVYAGRKEEAIKRLQLLHGATREEAEQLLKLAVKESSSPIDFFKRAAKAGTSHLSKEKGCKQSIYGMIAYGFGFFGIPLLLAASGIFIYQLYFISNSTRVIGVVSEVPDDASTQYRSVISYPVNGKTYSTQSTVTSSAPQYYVNDPVPLFVNNENPSDVMIDNFLERWMILTIIGCPGILFTLMMMVFLRKSR